MMKIKIIAITALVLTGCGVKRVEPYEIYTSNLLAPDQPVKISGFTAQPNILPGTAPHEAMLVYCLDGQSLLNYEGGYTSGFAHPAFIVTNPGKHGITAKYVVYGRYAYADLWMDAQSGREYLIRREIQGSVVKIWIEDGKTGAPVSSATASSIPGQYCPEKER